MSRQNFYFLHRKMYFFDKFNLKNTFQYPMLKQFSIKVPFCSSIFRKIELYKLLLFLYLLSGQKPKILVAHRSLKGLKKVQIRGLSLDLAISNLFLKFIIFRSMPLMTQFALFKPYQSETFNILLKYKTQDDDILLQLLNLTSRFSYQLSIKSHLIPKDYRKTLLISLKVPCKIKV